MLIKRIFEEQVKKTVVVKGWLVSSRGNDKIRFAVLNDGSVFTNLQVVLKGDLARNSDNLSVGSALEVHGLIKQTPSAQQPLELQANKLTVLKKAASDFPLQKQAITLEKLREIPHLRHRTNLLRAVMRVRSTLFQEIHRFFSAENFLYLSSPIITSNDGEGAGETFCVDSKKGGFFNAAAKLAVTGQLQAESYANGFGNVYTFGPTFRAENSNTQKHSAEFWMLEPEMAFTSRDEIIAFIERLLQTVIKKTLDKLPQEFDFFEKHTDKNIRQKLNNIIAKQIQKITYADAIKKLAKAKTNFQLQDIKFGIDLATEHEKYLAEQIFRGPVAVVDYPKAIKAFYMKQNDDNQTVAAFDILFPGVGEIIGGSERECDYQKIKNRIQEIGIDVIELQWYLDLRRFGHYQSSGFGLGFERLLMYMTGIENIRDSIPYPRTPNNLKM